MASTEAAGRNSRAGTEELVKVRIHSCEAKFTVKSLTMFLVLQNGALLLRLVLDKKVRALNYKCRDLGSCVCSTLA